MGDGHPLGILARRPDVTLPLIQLGLRRLVTPHPRARVWEEERHRYLPAWMVRPVYRALIAPIASLCARGSGRSRTHRCLDT